MGGKKAKREVEATRKREPKVEEEVKNFTGVKCKNDGKLS